MEASSGASLSVPAHLMVASAGSMAPPPPPDHTEAVATQLGVVEVVEQEGASRGQVGEGGGVAPSASQVLDSRASIAVRQRWGDGWDGLRCRGRPGRM